jgi:hypothetical protein
LLGRSREHEIDVKIDSSSSYVDIKFNVMWILQSDLLIHLEQHWFYLITWFGIVTSPTYSFANDKSKWSHEIIVIKIEESLNFVVRIKL